MNRKKIYSEEAPKPIGPYSQGIQTGDFVFTAGQIGIDPATGKLKEGIEEQTRQALRNISLILSAAGSSLEKVVKTTVFLADMNDFSRMNEVYGSFFPRVPPARSTVQVAKLPAEARVEIETIALL
jgi:2-iminobutanoate/2-iminopropanoate deaminase